jgi:hypothetical protein
MTKHVSEEELLTLLEGAGTPSDRAHVDACASCLARLEEARAGLDLAGRADVPEPSPLYWETLRRNVGRRIGEERWGAAARWGWLVPLAAAAATVAAVALSVGHAPAPSARPTTVLEAWSALPPSDRDEGLAVLEAIAMADGDLASWEEGRGVESFVAGLSDEDSQALAEMLRRTGQEGDL